MKQRMPSFHTLKLISITANKKNDYNIIHIE